MAKEGNQPNLVKDILPDKFANLLIGKEDKGGSMVASYAKTMDNHMFNHYETYFKTRANKPEDNQKINVMDLLYYHTYGDYRMVLNEKYEISFEYQVCPFDLGTISPQKSKFEYSETFHGEATPGLYGIYRKESPDPDGFRPSFSLISGQIPTLQEELNKGSSGLRLMLPSIGTLLIMTYGYTNINKEFRKMLKIILNELESAINRHISDEFGYLEYLIEMLRPHHLALSVEEKFEDNLKMYYARDTSEAYDYIINTIIEEQTTRFSLGERVILKENVSMNKTTEELLRTITPERFDLVDFTYEVRKSDIEDKKVVYYIFDPEENVEEGEEPTTVKVPQSILASTREPDKAFTQEKGKYFAIPEPSKLVAYSNIVDKLFTLHSYVFLCQEKHNFNTGYLSSGINNSKKPEQIRKQFPNMYSPSSSGNNIEDFAKGKVNENNCFIRNLLQMRNAYTQMILKAQRNAAFDTRVFDEFYKGDLTLKEISWLAFMLSEEAKIITKQPEKINALQQLTYVAPGVEGNIDLYGEANRRTIFYNVDIPLLKDVILEYVYAFNEITVRSAYSLEGKGNQEGAIAKALWGSIKKRTAKLFESLEVIPFEFFNELFSSVNNIISRGEMIKFDPYPPNWSDTNVLAYLTVNPNELNTFLSTEEYTLRLSEYLDYLYVRYGNRPRIAAAILTALEGYRIRISTEYQKIRTEFIDMIETHNKKSQLKGTDITFTAYLLAIAIMKAEAETPLIHREDYIAEGYEREQLRDILNARRYEDRFKIAAAPKGHPLYRELPTLAPAPPGPLAPPAPPSPPGPLAPPSPPGPLAPPYALDPPPIIDVNDEMNYPSMNQIEVNPVLQQDDAIIASRERGIPIVAFSPMADGSLFDNEIVNDIASELSVEPGDVLLAYAAKIADEVVSKTSSEERIRRGPMTPNIVLTDNHIARLRALRRDNELVRSRGTTGSSPSTFYYDADGKRKNPPKEMYLGTYEWPDEKALINSLTKHGIEAVPYPYIPEKYIDKLSEEALAEHEQHQRDYDDYREHLNAERYLLGIDLLKIAFDSGWTKIDTSDNYGTEYVIYQAIREYSKDNPEWKLDSLITKVEPDVKDLKEVELYFADQPIKEIHVLLHWPSGDYVNQYFTLEKEIERLNSVYPETKYYLGVSNFGRVHLERLEQGMPKEPEEEPEEEIKEEIEEEPEEEPGEELTVILATGTPSTGAYQSLPMINPVTTRGTPLTATTSFDAFVAQIMDHAPDFPLEGKTPPHPIYEKVDGMLISADEFSKTVDLWKTKTDAIYPKVKPSEEPVYVKADITLPTGFKLYVVGDVHCCIHTLTNFLVNNLKVKNDWTLPPYTKVAFCGDYVDRGPYGIEVLYTVLKLQAANPDSVFLCKGNHEDYEIFNDWGFVDEVTNQFDTTFYKPFDKVVEDLTVVTGSLPSALFISIQGKGMVQLCHGGIVHKGHEDHAKLKEYVQNKDNYGLITPKNTYHPLKWADFTQDDDYIGKNRGIDNNIFGIKQVEEYCESLGLVGIISGHQDKERHQIFTDMGTTLALKADMGVPVYSGPDFDLPQNTEKPLTFKPRVRSVVTSMAFPVREYIEFPAWVEIRN